MDAVERVAYITVGRACGFAGLAILCVMVGLCFEPMLAARSGGVLCLIMTLFLLWFARVAPSRPIRDTEAWLILDEKERPPAAVAQKLLGGALRDAYLWFARYTAGVTVVIWMSTIVLSLVAPANTS